MVGAMSTLATDAAVLIHEDEPAVHITLNRPDKRNALSLELMQDLIDSLRRVSASPGVRVIVLQAESPIATESKLRTPFCVAPTVAPP